MNVTKTKEIKIDFRSGVHHPNPVIDDKLRWDENTTNLFKKAGLDIRLVDAVARGASRFENLLAP